MFFNDNQPKSLWLEGALHWRTHVQTARDGCQLAPPLAIPESSRVKGDDTGSYETLPRSPCTEAPQGQGLGTSISVLLGPARSQEPGRCSQIDGRLQSTVLPAQLPALPEANAFRSCPRSFLTTSHESQILLVETTGLVGPAPNQKTSHSAGAESFRGLTQGLEHSRCSGICLREERGCFCFWIVFPKQNSLCSHATQLATSCPHPLSTLRKRWN